MVRYKETKKIYCPQRSLKVKDRSKRKDRTKGKVTALRNKVKEEEHSEKSW